VFSDVLSVLGALEPLCQGSCPAAVAAAAASFSFSSFDSFLIPMFARLDCTQPSSPAQDDSHACTHHLNPF